MITRRIFAGSTAFALLGLPAAAEDWKTRYPELTLAVVPNESASGTTNRFTPLADFLARKLGVPVRLRIAPDYAAVIDGHRSGTLHIGFHGAASYARAVMTGAKIQPIVTQIHQNGTSGYNSVIYVMAASPYKTIDDLKGKRLALVDPNSTSGNQAPRFFLKQAGHDVDTFFGTAFYAGSHESAVLALTRNEADAAANLWNSETDTMVTRMAAKGLLNRPDGTPMQQSDFQVVFKSDFLTEGPFAMLASLPEELKAKIREAFLAFPKENRAAFDLLSDGKDQGFTPVTLKDYQPIIDMLRFNEEQRKKS